MPTVWMGRLLRAGRVAAQPAGSARHARAVHIPGYVCTRDELDSRIRSAVSSALGQPVPAGPSVSRSRMLHGDYQSGVALAAARAAKRPPPDVARLVAAHLDGTGIVEDISVTGPGFINFKLSSGYVLRRLEAMLGGGASGRLGLPRVAPGRELTVVVDFSSPNIAKEMHVGHLRSTIIGDCISRSFEFLGHRVLRLNHVGDWGTQFGMLIHYLRERQPELCAAILRGGEPLAGAAIGDIAAFYKQARCAFEEDHDCFQDRSRAEVVRLQSLRPDSVAIWRYLCELSRAEFQKNYDLLGVQLTERGESFYNPLLAGLLDSVLQSGLAVCSDGAVVVYVPAGAPGGAPVQRRPSAGEGGGGGAAPEQPAVVLRKSDGGYLYATTDLAALRYRLADPGPHAGGGDGADVVLYVTDAGQALHFERIFSVAKLCGFVDDSKTVRHVPFGLVLGEDGKKLKSRSGDTVRLADLLNSAVEHADQMLKERGSGSGSGSGGLDPRAVPIGIAAVKYADLSVKREADYKFSPKKMTALSGNTAPYLLYTLVRIRGVRRRLQEAGVHAAAIRGLPAAEAGSGALVGAERDLAVKLACFDETLLDFFDDLYPHKICEYLYELCQLFNIFYETCPVLKAETESAMILRAALCVLTEDVLSFYLRILGIETVEEM